MSLDDYFSDSDERLEYEKQKAEMAHLHRESSPFCIDYYMRRGLDMEAAQAETEKMRLRMYDGRCKVPHPSTPQFYAMKGFDNIEASNLAVKYRRKIGRTPKKSELIKLWGKDEGNRRWFEYSSNVANRGEKFLNRFTDRREALVMQALSKGFGYSRKCHLDYNDFESYALHCRILTKLVIRAYANELDPTNEKLGKDYGKGGYHLDHQFSVYGGYYHKVDPFRICSIQNLRLILSAENMQKSQFCTITLDEVLNFKTILDEEWLSEECKERIRNVYC